MMLTPAFTSSPVLLYSMPTHSPLKREPIAPSIIKRGTSEHLRLAEHFIYQKMFGQAVPLLNRYLKENPENAEALNSLAYCLFMQSRVEIAERTYQLAAFVAPENPENLSGVANCLKAQGKFIEAIEIYKEILSQYPDHIFSLYHLALLGETARNTLLLHSMNQLYLRPDIKPDQRVYLGFALAKTYEILGDADKAFGYYSEANHLQFSLSDYDEAGFFSYIAEIKNTYTASFIAGAERNEQQARPIFIIGMPRSGTSLVEQILASHSEVHGAGELMGIHDIAARLIPQLTGDHHPRAIYQLNDSGFVSFAQYYLEQVASYAPPAGKHVIDKMPNNFLYLGLIKIVFPNAYIIHCTRNEVDTCWSMYRQHFAGTHPYCYDMGALGRFYRQYEELMQHWQESLPENSMFEVRYETLLQQPEQVITQLLSYLGLEFEEGCREFHKTNRAVNTASMQEVRRPLYHTSVESWQPVAERLAPLLAALKG